MTSKGCAGRIWCPTRRLALLAVHVAALTGAGCVPPTTTTEEPQRDGGPRDLDAGEASDTADAAVADLDAGRADAGFVDAGPPTQEVCDLGAWLDAGPASVPTELDAGPCFPNPCTGGGACLVVDAVVMCCPNPELCGPLTAITGTGTSACALASTGEAVFWGPLAEVYADPDPQGTYTQLAAGDGWVCGVDMTSTVRCWGDVPVSFVPAGTIASAIVANDDSVCALLPDGAVECWGAIGYGPDFAAAAEQIVAGSTFMCARLADGSVDCWGYLIGGPWTPPEGITFTDFSAHSHDVCGVASNGRIWCWVAHAGGDDVEYTSYPGDHVRAFAGAGCGLLDSGDLNCWGPGEALLPSIEPGRTVVDMVHAGALGVCALLDDGYVACVGGNLQRQASPPPGVGRLSLAAGSRHTCSLDSEGDTYCWGGATSEPLQLSVQPATEVTVGFGAACTALVGGGLDCWWSTSLDDPLLPAEELHAIGVGYKYGCGLRSDDTIRCWGDQGPDAEPPDGAFDVLTVTWDSACASSLERCETRCWGGDNDVSAFGRETTPYKVLSAGREGVCGLLPSGELECWHGCQDGVCDTPPGVFLDVGRGLGHACALRDDLTIICWGRDAFGQGTAPAGLYLDLAVGELHNCAVPAESDGIVCWGAD